jgi:OmpA-OmpF porin, OOP family
MSRTRLLAGFVALLALSPPPLSAQPSAPEAGTQRLIEQLCPPGVVCRGIRMPGADTGAATPAPTLTAPDAPQPPSAALPQPPTMSVPPPGPTTAPAGVAAVSLTVNFPTGSATLTPQAAAALGDLGRALASAELAPYRFRIEGHTDTVGDDRLNMLLSQRRAESVRDFLAKRYGVAPARLVAVGLGESQPLVPTPDQTPEPSNRRVQVLNLGG